MTTKDQAVRVARGVNRRLRRAAGRPLPPSPPPPGRWRLVDEPVFVLSNVRSGSTLLRVVLNSHPQICAPLEMHLRGLRVTGGMSLTEDAMKQLGLGPRTLENMLWDRVLFDRLLRSGKPIVVDKTPGNVLAWDRIHRYWPRSKFIVLYRHPVRIVDSWQQAHPELAREKAVSSLFNFTKKLVEAYEVHGGLVVRYEDLTNEPERVTKEICRFLGVDWDSRMIEYGLTDHGPHKRGLGDWGEKINSGRIAPAPPNPAPEDVPDDLKDMCRLMGYL